MKIWLQEKAEGFKLCEISEKVQCTHCLRYSAPGNIYCRCGTSNPQAQADPETLEQTRKFNQERFDVFTIARFLVKTNLRSGNRYGSTADQEAYYRAKKSHSGATLKGYFSIHDRLLRDDKYRKSQLEIGWPEEMCNLILSHKKTTQTLRREMSVFGTEDFGVLPRTTRHRPANVKTSLKLFQNFVKRKTKPSPVVKISVLIHHCHEASRSCSSANSLIMYIHHARENLEHMCKMMRPQHSWWSSSSSNWWHGWQDWHSSKLLLSIVEGISLTKDSDLHMSDGGEL